MQEFFKLFNKKLEDLGEIEIRQYLLSKFDGKNVSHAFVSQSLSALKILFRDILHKPKVIVNIPHPKKEHKLPEVFSRQEIIRFFEAKRRKLRRMCRYTLSGILLRRTFWKRAPI